MKITSIFIFFSLSLVCERLAFALEEKIAEKKYSYNEGFLLGNAKDISIDKLTEDQSMPGNWFVDLYLNNEFIYNKEIKFYENEQGKIVPCLTKEDIDSFQIKSEYLKSIKSNEQCEDLYTLSKDVQIKLKQDILRLDILIPQIMVEQYARGLVPVSALNEGIPALFLNYNLNGYNSRNYGKDSHSIYGNISTGINLGLYRIRHQSNLQYNQDNKFIHESVRTYIQRAIPQIESELTVGQSFTNGSIFDSFSYTGAELTTDNRMRPQSLQGFAPTVRGIANSNAHVKIIQNGYVIYETNVSPGEFTINDLYATGYGGDLTVQLTEANGNVSSFIVPFSTVPGLLRLGQIDYSIVSGKLRGDGISSDIFVQSTVQYGLSNIVTPFVGVQYSNKYQSGLLGLAVNTQIGAFSFDVANSKSELDNNRIYNGARARVTWNKDINATGTNIALAGYRYESQNYLSLYEASSDRKRDLFDGDNINPRRAQYVLTINQNLADYGTAYASGSLQTWRDNLPDTKQLQAGYMNNFKGIGYSLTYIKMYRDDHNGSDNNYVFNVSVPFSIWYPEQNTLLSSSVSRSEDRWLNNTSVSSTLGEDKSMDWNASVSNIGQTDSSFSGNIQKDFSIASVNAGYSQGNDFKSFSVGASGALVAYQGGVIPSRYLSETFAIVEANEAEGASISSWSNIVIDKGGKAIVPSLTPYQYNTLYLNSENMNTDIDIDIDNNMVKIAPYAGSSVLVKFDTKKGTNIIYRIKLQDNKSVPFGADIYDENNNKVGLVGQGGLVYFNSQSAQGTVIVKWGSDNNQSCIFNYNVSNNSSIPELICRYF